MPLSRVPANLKFAYSHIDKKFVEKSTNINYRINDIVRATSTSSIPTLCRQFFDISSSITPPSNPSLFEYEPIQQFFADPNYLLNNNTDALPTRPPRKLRRLNMLHVKLHSNVSQMSMSIASALRHPNAAEFMAVH